MTEDSDPSLSGWPGQSTCVYCGAELTRSQSRLGRCDSEACKSRKVNESHHQQYRQKWNAFVADQHSGAAAHGGEIVAGARALGSVPDKVTVGIVPHQTRPMEPLPEARRAAFLAHLRAIIAESFTDADPPVPNAHRAENEREDPAVSNAACIACLGHCCILGAAANAFLRVGSINNVRSALPDLDAEAIAEYYETHLPDQIVQNSCVFHGPLGCTLDRTWRADMCNNFQCNAKRQGLKRLHASGDDAMLWLATSSGSGRAMVHDGDGTREVMVEPADRDPTLTDAAVASVTARLPLPIEEAPVVVGPVCRMCGSALPVGHQGPTCGSAACNLAGPR